MIRKDQQRPGLQDQRGQVAGRRRRDRRAQREEASRSSSARSPSRSPRCSAPAWRAHGVPHIVLNAKPEHAEQEGETVAEAGSPGAVTIATNMAGRGVDIKLGGNPEHLAAARAAQARPAARRPRLRRALRGGAAGDRAPRRGGPRQGRRGRRPLHHRHRAPRVAPHRQPAARPLRPPGRPGRVALLPLRRGRPRAAVRRRADLQDPRPLRHDRRRGQRGADRGRPAVEADREGAEEGRGAELPHPQARARLRRRHERAAADRLRLPRRGARGPRHGRRRRASEIAQMLERTVDEYTPGDYIEDWDIEGLFARSREIFPVSFTQRRHRPETRSSATSCSGSSARTR